MKASNLLLILGLHFFLLSFIAFGGGNSIIPDLHRLMVQKYKWMSEQEFITLFAISRAAPGPNVLISTLLGWYVAHLPGALIATFAICTPSCILAYTARHFWDRSSHKKGLKIFKEGIFPILMGVLSATVLILVELSNHSRASFVITVLTALLAYTTKFHPLWILGGAMILGLLGWV